MKLEFPELKHKKDYEILIKTWGKLEDLDEMSPGALFLGDNYEDFLEITKKDKIISRTGVNSDLYFIVNDSEKIVGAIQLRHSLGNPILKEFGGHIGYGIAPEFRRKGYANEAVKLLLIKAKDFGLNKILITCEINNIASEKIIERNGGVFERLSECGKYKRFWIVL